MNDPIAIPSPQVSGGTFPSVSLIIPVYNEALSIGPVLDEVMDAMKHQSHPYEVLVVDDGSTDKTADILKLASQRHTSIRVFTIIPNSGQSAAFGVGFAECRHALVVLMDGDGQNDPHDIPMLLAALSDCDACCGYRATRRDTLNRRLGSRIANRVRQYFLHDGIRDTGCSLKAVKVEFLRNIPMQFRGMHRFLPALWLMQGARIKQLPVAHRPRAAGHSKYTNWGRLKETVWDLWAVRWMQKRHRRFHVVKGGPSA
jgi:dolichol-phosphate mannosyltransferase